MLSAVCAKLLESSADGKGEPVVISGSVARPLRRTTKTIIRFNQSFFICFKLARTHKSFKIFSSFRDMGSNGPSQLRFDVTVADGGPKEDDWPP